MARRLPNSRQIPTRNKYHGNAVRTTHARERGATLAEEPAARIDQFLEAVSQRLHRASNPPTNDIITRGTESL